MYNYVSMPIRVTKNEIRLCRFRICFRMGGSELAEDCVLGIETGSLKSTDSRGNIPYMLEMFYC